MSYCEDSNINKSYIVQSPTEADIFSACTEIFLTNITPCTGDTININSNLYVTGNISGSTYYGDGSNLLGVDNFYVTGGTLQSDNTLLLSYNTTGLTLPSIDLSGIKFTGNTSGDCITDLYVSNIHSCSPLNINPNDEGNVYFGSTSAVTIDLDNVRFGVGTETPSFKLHLFDDVDNTLAVLQSDDPRVNIRLVDSLTTNTAVIGASGNSITFGHISGGDRMVITDDGNVGIGIENPTEKLHVIGNGIIDGSSGSTKFYPNGDYLPDGRYSNVMLLEGYNTPSGSTAILLTNDVPSGSENIAIGTLSKNRLDSLSNFGGNSDSFVYGSSNVNNLNIINEEAGVTGRSDSINFWAGTSPDDTPIPHLKIQGSGSTKGYVGIGIENPLAKLHINNTTSGNTIRIEDDTTPDSTPTVIDNKGWVGIGTELPGGQLDIKSQDTSDTLFYLRSPQYSGATEVMRFVDTSIGSTYRTFGTENGVAFDNYGGTNDEYEIRVNNQSAFRVDTSRNIGIGTNNPISRLHVSGDTNINGNLIVDNNLSANTINIVTTPTLNNSNTEIISRNTSTGEIEYTDLSAITALTSSDIYVTGQTFNNSSYILSTTRNDGNTINTDLSVLASDIYVLSGVYDISTGIVTYTNNSGGTFEVSGFTTGMTDSYTTSANLNGQSIEFDNNIQGAGLYSVDLTPLLSGKTNNSDFYTYTANTQTELDTKISTVDAQNNYVNVSGDTMTGDFVLNGSLSATTISGGTLYGDGSNLTGVVPPLSDGQIFVGDSGNTASAVDMTGDVNIDNTGNTTIQPDSVTYDKMQDVSQAAMLGNTNTSGGTITEIPIVDEWLPTGTATTLLEDTNNWDINGVYTGTTITGTFQSQKHYDSNYMFMAVDDNLWIRLIRG